MLIPMAVLSKAKVWGRSITEIGGLNPAKVMEVRLLCLLCV
jgi:hypothetical protein